MYDGPLQLTHPDRVVDEAGFVKLSGIDPVYPLTEGLALGSLRRAMAQALQKLPDLPEWTSPEVIRRCGFPPLAEALQRVHIPVELTDILPDGPFWSRLAFDELLAGQLALALVGAPCGRRDRSCGRHPRADPGRRGVQGAGARRGRRAASFRRARTAGADRQGRRRRRAGAERDADPAHAGADVFWRHGCFRTAREARRAAADRYPRGAQQPSQR